MKTRTLFLAGLLLLVACGQRAGADGSMTAITDTMGMIPDTMPGQRRDLARAELRDAEGNSLGEVDLRATDGGVTLSGTLGGLAPGEHGFHIHEMGRCEPPAFESAGGHFAPAGRQHGFDHPDGPHAGDLPNLQVADDGTAVVSVTDSLVSLRGGEAALLDADGSALVVHAGPDDYISQPSGDSGDPIACGVIEE